MYDNVRRFTFSQYYIYKTNGLKVQGEGQGSLRTFSWRRVLYMVGFWKIRQIWVLLYLYWQVILGNSLVPFFLFLGVSCFFPPPHSPCVSLYPCFILLKKIYFLLWSKINAAYECQSPFHYLPPLHELFYQT